MMLNTMDVWLRDTYRCALNKWRGFGVGEKTCAVLAALERAGCMMHGTYIRGNEPEVEVKISVGHELDRNIVCALEAVEETPMHDHVPTLLDVMSEEVKKASNKYSLERAMTPETIILNGKATVVIWPDKTKTVVKCSEGEVYSPYNAFASALAIKIFGSNSALKKMLENRTVEQKKKEKKRKEAAE